VYCSNCGKEIVKNSKFCKHCGFPLQKGESNNNDTEKEESTTSNEEVINENVNKELNFVEIIKEAKDEGKLRAEIINLLVENGLTNNEAEKLIQKVDGNENLESISIEEIKEEEFSDEKLKVGEVESDSLDKWLGIKGRFSKSNLAEKRFKISYQILYFLSIWNILLGIYLTYGSSSNLAPNISGNEVLWGGVIYIILTFSFHMLKMPLLLGFLALGMLADKLFTIVSMQKIGGVAIIVSIILLLGTIQSFRSAKNLQKTKNKVLKGIVSFIFIVILILGIIVSINPNIFEDTEWDNEKTSLFKDAISKSYSNLNSNPKLKNINELYLKGIAEKTAECAINEIKRTFPNYANFVSGLEKDGDNDVKRELTNIKSNCFQKTLNSLPKKELKKEWPLYAATNIVEGIKIKYLKLYKDKFGPFTKELEKHYGEVSLNIGKCTVDNLKIEFKDFNEFEKGFLSKKDNKIKSTFEKIEIDCLKKHHNQL